MKRLLLFTALLAMTASVSFGQTRRVLVEEFTGSWCGWCPRGALALQQMSAHYPGTAIGLAVHNSDPMAFAQADSLTGGAIGFPSAAQFPGFPSGWVTRVLNGTSQSGASVWYTDPMNWVDTLNWSTGIVDQALLETAKATISTSNITFDPTTGMVSVDLKAHFAQSMSGDFRFNVMVSEDSVSGAAGTTYDQHNYYYHNGNYPKSPYYNAGAGAAGNGLIANYVYYHVYRGSMAGIHGAAGIIPSAVTAGQDYTTTFRFRLPFTVMNPNHVNLIAVVHQYSATDPTKNEVFDAEEKPLSTTPIKIVTADYTFNPQSGYNPSSNSTYVTALSGGDSSQIISFFNSSDKDVTLSLSVDQSKLPEGWTYTPNPATVNVPASGSASTQLKISAPSQSNFVVASLLVTPTAQGAWGQTAVYPIYALSSNTKNALLWTSYPEYAAINGMPTDLRPNFAVMPLNDDVLSNYPISDMDLAVIATPLIDNNSGYYNFPNPLSTIETMLQNGKKVFLTSDLGLYYALDPNAQANGQSAEGTSFFQDTLGLTLRSSTSYYNSSTGAYSSFKVTATNDPISKGLTSTLNANGLVYPQQLASSFDVDASKSTPLFYYNSSTAQNAAIRYQNDAGGKLVLLAFRLNAIANQSTANKIASNAIDWLMAPPQAVAQPKMTNEGMFATSNPFVGRTEIRYTPKADESNVTFSAYDVLGHEVATMTSKMVSGAYTATFDASTLASGTYTIVAHTSTGAHQIRVVAE